MTIAQVNATHGGKRELTLLDKVNLQVCAAGRFRQASSDHQAIGEFEALQAWKRHNVSFSVFYNECKEGRPFNYVTPA